MIFSSAVESFSVSVQFRMACSVFVQPPVYTMPLTAAFAATSSTSVGKPAVISELVANSTMPNRASPISGEAVRLPMRNVAKSFVSV